MHRLTSQPRDRAAATRWGPRSLALLAALAAPGSGCATPPPESDPPPDARARERGDEALGRPVPPAQRTANSDRRGFDKRPDYDAEAQDLRAKVDPRMPSPLPADAPTRRETACASMLDAAAAFYAEVEREGSGRARVTQAVADTRAEDLAACVRETSVAAATCVTILLGDRDTEFPWLLDQCSRAYPAS